MMSKKLLIASLLSAAVFSLLIFQSSAPPPPVPPEVPEFAQQPPLAKNVWIKKVVPVLPAGENLVMKIEYAPDPRLDTVLSIYYRDDAWIDFHDDGVAPDVTAGDYIYSAYLEDDLSALRGQLVSLDASLSTRGTYQTYTGHVGQEKEWTGGFDAEGFDLGSEVGVPVDIVLGYDCGSEIKKQNSLFITDLAVVEDPARTYNVAAGSGNPEGVWTFGNLVKNMAYEHFSGHSAKDLLKVWLRRWAYGDSINGQWVPARTHVFRQLIGPWLQKANPTYIIANYGSDFYENSSDEVTNNWEAIWELTSQESILQYAPFRLMAIVNRIDLHQNMAYASGLGNGGEIRFIFTLISPFNIDGNGVVFGSQAGMPPNGGDGSGSSNGCDNVGRIDWTGMNIILEYRVPIVQRCVLRNYAQDWVDLSLLTLGTAAYNEALEELTHVVIDSNAAPSRTDNNKSAIAQVRTNERLFFPSLGNCSNISTWEPSDWELSQFEIKDGWLKPAPVTNTPERNANGESQNIGLDGDFYGQLGHTGYWKALTDWVYGNKPQVLAGNHDFPLTYSYDDTIIRRAATAVIDAEQVHFWDFYWEVSTNNYTAINPNTPNPEGKDLRLQFALNTCQGCHSGENKTLFTMIRPLGYGQSARYWIDTPDYDIGSLDSRFAQNLANSSLNGYLENNHLFPPDSLSNFVRVSPFLTGRIFSGPAGNGHFQDDNINGSEDLTDPFFEAPNMITNYYVYEPTNRVNQYMVDKTVPLTQRFSQFNDLQRRKTDMCTFINGVCQQTKVISILIAASQQPLPLGGH